MPAASAVNTARAGAHHRTVMAGSRATQPNGETHGQEEGRRQALLMAERDPKTGRFPPRPQAPKGGRGYGGAAKGEGSKAGLTPEVRALRWDEAKLAEKAVRTDALKGVMWEIAMDAAEAAPARINAADKLLDREEGKAVQKTQLSGVDGAPLVIERRIVDPKAAE